MLTTIVVGNRFTRRKKDFIYTPRGYNSWDAPSEKASEPEETSAVCPSTWIFSGTSDGNALAAELANSGHNVIVSAATDYGREVIVSKFPNLTVRSGRIGVEARRRELLNSNAKAIIDATHPFATEISAQLIGLSEELGIPYLRYERPSGGRSEKALYCSGMEEAATVAMQRGNRIFLSTGSKDLPVFLNADGAAEREWYVRVAPDTASLERAVALGIPRSRLCVMQGPFSRDFNEALWRSWNVDCVVTKESGEAGGFEAKVEAAAALNIPLIVVERPALKYPTIAHDFKTVCDFVNQLAATEPAST
jgi:precorrin-3B C17-methyltransferase